MSDLMVYSAMFCTTIDKIICFMCPHKMKKESFAFNLGYHVELGPFLISPPNFELFPTVTWDYLFFLMTPPPLFGPGPKFCHFFIWKASFIPCALCITSNGAFCIPCVCILYDQFCKIFFQTVPCAIILNLYA